MLGEEVKIRNEPTNDEKALLDDAEDAVLRGDWDALRRLSLRPGGFGKVRREAWKLLLHVNGTPSMSIETRHGETGLRLRKPPPSVKSNLIGVADTTSRTSEASADTAREEERHRDEHQIKLDTDRSFVLYSVDDDSISREEMQTRLNVLITQVFRRLPKLRYFQGYHDIITVILLTLPQEERLLCAKQLSLHHLRDSMGEGMQPMLGLLQIMKYLMRLADPEYAALLERSAPLPYFALSNLLTLFSHDVPTIPLIQHVFDFLLCRPPIAVVYLATAVTLARRAESFEMEAKGEEGMLHSLHTQLPDLSDGDEQLSEDVNAQSVSQVNGTFEKVERPGTGAPYSHFDPEKEATDFSGVGLKVEKTVSGTTEVASLDGDRKEEESDPKIVHDTTNISPETSGFPSIPTGLDLFPTPDSSQESDVRKVPSRSSSPTPSHASTSSGHSVRRRRPTVSLPALLSHADSLYTEFPPTLPALHVSDILGPNSVVRTWSEDPAKLPSDDEAGDMATNTSLIVLPFVDPDDAAAEAALERKRAKARRKGKGMSARSVGYRLLNGVSRVDIRSKIFGGVVFTIALIYMISPRARTLVYSVLMDSWTAEGLFMRAAEKVMHRLGWSSGR